MPFGLPTTTSQLPEEAQVQNAFGNTSVRQGQTVDPMWDTGETTVKIDYTLWNKALPYQLVVVNTRPDGGYIQDFLWTFTLPIPPESLSIAMPFAITTNVTLGGIIEEHNGAPLRMISFRGTTGVLPLRGAASQRGSASVAGSIFAGTVQSIQNVQNAFNTLVNGPPTSNPNLISVASFGSPSIPLIGAAVTSLAKTSGYAQFRLLQMFLERYAAYKKTAAGAGARLALCFWKQESVYLVTPQSFEVSQSAQSPFEYTYNLTFKAWKRISLLNQTGFATEGINTPRTPGFLQNVLAKIAQARQLLAAIKSTLAAVQADLSKVFSVIRQFSLAVKDLLAIPLALGDFSRGIISDVNSATAALLSVPNALASFPDEFVNQFNDLGWEKDVSLLRAQGTLGDGGSISSTSPAAGLIIGGGGSTPGSNKGGGLTQVKATAMAKVFADPDSYPAIFDNIKIAQLKIPPTTRAVMQNELAQVRAFTRQTYEDMLSTISSFAADFADFIGAGDTTYDTAYNRTPATASKRTATQKDYEALYALNDIVDALNVFASSKDSDKLAKQRLSSVEYIAGLARASGIAFKIPRSKYAVPFPYKSTLEQVAQKYLGNSERWMEIAALNGLRTPYVDEEGFDLDFLAAGSGNQIVVEASDKLYLGQMVWLSSTATSRSQRRIVGIDRTAPDQVVLTLDGDSDLDRFTVVASASLHTFTPDTVNSQQLIYIPSDVEPQEDTFITKDLPGVDELDNLVRVGGIDLLLDPSGDLVLTQDADVRFAVGMTNIVQKVRLAFSVEQGTLNQHPNFGIPIKVGGSTAEMDATTVLSAVRSVLNGDPSFSDVRYVRVVKNGPGMSISTSVGVAGTNQYLPITVDVQGATR